MFWNQDKQGTKKTRRGRTSAQKQQEARTDARTDKWNAWRQHASSKHPPQSQEQWWTHQFNSESSWDYTDHVQTAHKGWTWKQYAYEHIGISDVQTRWEDVDQSGRQNGLGAWQQQTSTERPITDLVAVTLDSEEVWMRSTRQRTDVRAWDTSHSSMVMQVGHVNYLKRSEII